jgi:LuxR family maltose regulon positive regulatory protein
VRITTLGKFQVRVGVRNVAKHVLRQRRAGELLGLLLITPAHSLSYDQIAEALWPDKDPAAAQILFHHATSALRRIFEPDLPEKFPSRYLEVSDGLVVLHPPPGSSVDYERFDTSCKQQAWEAALACYEGEFLPEYRYADWSIVIRQRLMQNYQHALLEQAAAWIAEGRYTEVLDACQRVVALEPWQEQAVLLGMRACLKLNDRTGALRWYKNLEKSLRIDLGAEPQEELQSLYHSLLKR